MTVTLSKRECDRLFLEEVARLGYPFTPLKDEKRRLRAHVWRDDAAATAGRPAASCWFNFVRRTTWMEPDLSLTIENVRVWKGKDVSSERLQCLASNWLQWYRGYPKTHEGVLAASIAVVQWVERLRAEAARLEQCPPLNFDDHVLWKSLNIWLRNDFPGWRWPKDMKPFGDWKPSDGITITLPSEPKRR
jgi:hypothetical protein